YGIITKNGSKYYSSSYEVSKEQWDNALLNQPNVLSNLEIKPYNESRFQTSPIEATTTFKDTIEQLSNRFGIPVFYDTTLKVGGMFKDGRIYLNPDKITPETHWHE